MIDTNRLWRGVVNEIAPGVWYVPALMANLYFVGQRGGPWVMVDAGTPGTGLRIRAAVKEVFGDQRPSAIVLTHGHFDHVGSLRELADEWDVPVFAHPLEFPYLDGRDNYPPPDPTVGGFMAQLSRFFPKRGINVAHRLRPFLVDNTIPFMPGWRTVHTPGHTAGHISLFRDDDRTLIAGDAVITIDQQNAAKLLSQKRELHGPPSYFTPDWGAAHESIRRLAELRPTTVATGHGLPMSGADVADKLTSLAETFQPPLHGRYVNTPAVTNERGVVSVPPAPRDPVPIYAAGIAVAAAGVLLLASRRRRSHDTYASAEMMPVYEEGEYFESAESGDQAALPASRDDMAYDIFGRKP
jgi:glyoxylase-like metal-dependent hydrolase (beta-lactamase superfamily II)